MTNKAPSATLSRIAKLGGAVRDLVAGQVAFRSCTVAGRLNRAKGGLPVVANDGRIEIGSRCTLCSTYVPSRLVSRPGGEIVLGDGTYLNFGNTIVANRRVRLGAGVSLGAYCSIDDGDAIGPAGDPVAAAPIEIGDGAWLANRVRVLAGATVGAGSVVIAGSVVAGDIPPGVLAGGIPARVLRALGTRDAAGDAAAAATMPIDGPGPTPAPVAPAPAPAAAPAAPAGPAVAALVIADFTADELARRLSEDAGPPRLAADVAPFQQVVPSLLALGDDPPPLVVVWTLAEWRCPSFARILAGEPADLAAILDEVDAFADLVVDAADAARCVVVPTWTMPSHHRGLGAADLRPGGTAHALLAMNARLVERLAARPNLFALDAARWVARAGRNARPPKLWYMGKVAYGDAVLDEAVADIKAAYGALTGAARKLVVVDLDDTMWGGIVGDIGWEALRIGGHDSVGEAFVDFQHALKALANRGILLALASKNDEAVALEAIRRHPEMILRERDFAAYRINWRDKAQNVADIAAELNLGLQSVVFLDDNPVERARVREMLPEVLVPDWPEDKHLYAAALAGLRCFDQASVSREDANRTAMMHAERGRKQAAKVTSIEDWLASLDMRVAADPVSAATLARTVQLLNKTNQLNLATRRLTEAELTDWLDATGRAMWVFDVSDRFGDSGLTGIVGIEADGGIGRVTDFVLSCRVMGRKVEETLVHVAVAAARERGLSRLVAELVPTAKNKPCLEFWARSGFRRDGEYRFEWDVADAYPLPAAITLTGAAPR